MEFNLKKLLPIGLIVLAVMFIMKMMKGKRCEGFTQQQPQKVQCNCNVQAKNDQVENFWGCQKTSAGPGTLTGKKPKNNQVDLGICKAYYPEDYDGDKPGYINSTEGQFANSCNKFT